MKKRPSSLKNGGFTLLEIILSMALVSVLLGSVFAIVSGTTQMASEVQREQDHDAQSFSFAQLCTRTFRGLNGNGQVRLRVKESGRHYLGQLSIINAPSVLGAAGNVLLVIETEEATSGYMRIVLKTYSPKNALAFEASNGRGVDPDQRLVLLDNVSHCDWRVLNPNTGEWETLLNDKINYSTLLTGQIPGLQLSSPASAPPTVALPTGTDPMQAVNGQPAASSVDAMLGLGTRPGLIDLSLSFGSDPPQRFVFWVPPAVSPQAQKSILAAPTMQPPPTGSPAGGVPGGGQPAPVPVLVR